MLSQLLIGLSIELQNWNLRNIFLFILFLTLLFFALTVCSMRFFVLNTLILLITVRLIFLLVFAFIPSIFSIPKSLKMSSTFSLSALNFLSATVDQQLPPHQVLYKEKRSPGLLHSYSQVVWHGWKIVFFLGLVFQTQLHRSRNIFWDNYKLCS